MPTSAAQYRAKVANGKKGGRPRILPEGERRPPGVKPGFMYKENVTLKQKALKYSEEALRTLVWLMRYSENPTVKLAATDKILDRAHGRVPLSLEHDGKGGGAITLLVVTGVPEPDEPDVPIEHDELEFQRGTLSRSPELPDMAQGSLSLEEIE